MLKQFAIALLVVFQWFAIATADQPNVILIVTDDQSWDSLAFMGGKVHTPRIDQMAKEELYLTNFNFRVVWVAEV
jgi:hypothetical protein